MPVNDEFVIPRVERFLALVTALDAIWDPGASYLDDPRYTELRREIDGSISFVKTIADQCKPGLSDRITKGLQGTFGYTGAVSAVTELLRQLRAGEQR
jgi:hypothetical protein